MPSIETVFASPFEFIAVCAVLLVAELVYVLLGFGAGLIAVGALAVVLPEIRDVVVLVLLVNLPAELFVVASSWRRISWRGVLVICGGILVGVPAGTWFLRWGEPTFLLVLLGAFLVVAGCAFLAVPNHRTVRWPTWFAPIVGLMSGVLAGTFGTGGPPLIFYYQLSGSEKAVFRGNLMAIFLLITCVRVPAYAFTGLLTEARLWSGLAVLPAVLLGACIGNHVHLQVAEATFRRLVSAALVVIGVVLLAQRVV